MQKKTSITAGILSLLLLLFLFSCGSKEKKTEKPVAKTTDVSVDTVLQSRLKAFTEKPRVSGRFGLFVYDLTARKPVIEVNADHSQPLASNLKLLAGVAALHRLGADYKYQTSLYTRGPIVGDTLKGDVMLWAGLDPQLKAEDMRMFTRELRRIGIRHIDGRCYLKLTLKDKVQAEKHWYPWDLSFSHYGILYKGPDAIMKAMRTAFQSTGISFVKAKGNTKTNGSNAGNSGNAVSSITQSGLTCNGVANAIVPAPWPSRLSPSLRGRAGGEACRFRFYRTVDRVINKMWKNSSNTQATSLLYTLGAELLAERAVPQAGTSSRRQTHCGRNIGSYPAALLASTGVDYIHTFLKDTLHMRDTALVVHDGCGLCTHNHLSPRAVGSVLIFGYNHKPIYRTLMRNLSISGVDGTIRRLLADPALRGKIHAKTGTLSHPYGISSLAGYCRGANGHVLCFALLDSDMSVLDAHVLQRQLCKELVK